MKLYLTPTVFNETSDSLVYGDPSYNGYDGFNWNPAISGFTDAQLTVFTYDAAASLGTNTALRITAKPEYDYEGNVVWSVTPVSGPTITTYSYANITQVLVTSGGTGYSNTDTIRFSNGQVDATASLFTNSSGGIVYVNLTSRGNFSNGAVANTETFTANSTVNNNFTMNRSVSSNTDIQVAVNGLLQTPTTDYGVSGSTLTFTANLTVTPSPDVVTLTHLAGITPGVGFKTASQISAIVSNSTSITSSNTSAGSGAQFDILLGGTANSVSSSPRVTNDTITLYSSSTTAAESVVLVKADFYLANGYANIVGTASQTFTLKNSTTPAANTGTGTGSTSGATGSTTGVTPTGGGGGGGVRDERVNLKRN
jgi:hypothetical protein